ncbi:hypothetical protein Tsubulata_047680, partial [Turnera subulata]
MEDGSGNSGSDSDDSYGLEESNVAWLWVIEYLASFPQINPSILHDLIEAAPELPDELGNNTSEMVALWCLEHLFPHSHDHTNRAIPCASDKRVSVNLSESCQNVLQSILQETSVSDWKRGGPEPSKWNIRPFIAHKRGSMPPCALEQLKDAPLDGTYPLATHLTKLGALDNQIYNDGDQADYGKHDAVTRVIEGDVSSNQIMGLEERATLPTETENILGRDVSHEGEAPILERGPTQPTQNDNEAVGDGLCNKDLFMLPERTSTCMPAENENFVMGNDLQHRDMSTVVEEGSTMPVEVEIVNGLAGDDLGKMDLLTEQEKDDLHGRELLCLKRDVSDLTRGNQAEDLHVKQGCVENDDSSLHSTAKRLKHDASFTNQSEQTSIPPHDKELIGNYSEEMAGDTEKLLCVEKEIPEGECMGKSSDDVNLESVSKRTGWEQDANAMEGFQYSQCETAYNTEKEPEDACGDGNDGTEPGASNGEISLETLQNVSVCEANDISDGSAQIPSLNGSHEKVNDDEVEADADHLDGEDISR